MARKASCGFSLVEVLVVISTVSVVVAVSMPAFVTAKSRARGIVCRSNLRQLVLANTAYSDEHDGLCVPAASDLWKDNGGYKRWHGERDNEDEPFKPRRGPLVGYLSDGQVKECPERVDFAKGGQWAENFEQGCGGYGYNMTYIGGRLWCNQMDFRRRYSETARLAEIKRPEAAVMFADCALARSEGRYIEYSFAEPPFFLINGKEWRNMMASPSIHFRHYGSANIGWADGHIELRPMAEVSGKNVYNVLSARMNLGWFEPADNTPFDLE